MAGTLATLRELTQIADETGSRYDSLMAAELRVLLGGSSGPGPFSEAARAVINCATAEEFLTRVRRIRPA